MINISEENPDQQLQDKGKNKTNGGQYGLPGEDTTKGMFCHHHFTFRSTPTPARSFKLSDYCHWRWPRLESDYIFSFSVMKIVGQLKSDCFSTLQCVIKMYELNRISVLYISIHSVYLK